MFRCKGCGAFNRVPDPRAQRQMMVVACGRCKTALDLSGAPQDVDAAALAHALQRCPIPVLVDFWAPWCQPCRVSAHVIEQVARDHAGSVITLLLNTEREPAPAVVHGVHGLLNAQSWGGVPTLILFSGGREVARRSGAVQRLQLNRWLESAQRAPTQVAAQL